METKNKNGQAKNGQVQNGAGAKVVQMQDTSNGVAALAKIAPAPIPVNPVLEKIAKINELQRATVKLHKLNETRASLASFNLGSDKLTDTLEIEDGDKNRFYTTNSDIIKKVVSLLKAEVNCKIIDVEEEILSVVI